MQIHELNNFTGTLGAGSYVAIDDGNDTGKVSTQQILANTEARIDNIIAGDAPSAAEVTDARYGADGVTYTSLGTAIRTQVSDLKADISAYDDSVDKTDLLLSATSRPNKTFVVNGGYFWDNSYWDGYIIKPVPTKTIRVQKTNVSTFHMNFGFFNGSTYIEGHEYSASKNFYELTIPNNCTQLFLSFNKHDDDLDGLEVLCITSVGTAIDLLEAKTETETIRDNLLADSGFYELPLIKEFEYKYAYSQSGGQPIFETSTLKTYTFSGVFKIKVHYTSAIDALSAAIYLAMFNKVENGTYSLTTKNVNDLFLYNTVKSGEIYGIKYSINVDERMIVFEGTSENSTLYVTVRSTGYVEDDMGHKAKWLQSKPKTVYVASSTATEAEKTYADYVCDGTNDEKEINQAIRDVAPYGTVELSSGTFYIDAFETYATGIEKAAIHHTSTTLFDITIKGQSRIWTILEVTNTAFSTVNETDCPSVITGYRQSAGLNVNNLRVALPNNERKVICYNGQYVGKGYCHDLSFTAAPNSSEASETTPNMECIAMRSYHGDDNGIDTMWDSIIAIGFGRAYQLGAEHMILRQVNGRYNYCTYTFGEYEVTMGNAFSHPITLINCADEHQCLLPQFYKCGAMAEEDTEGHPLQEVDFISFNIERWQDWLEDQDFAKEDTQGDFCGRIEYTMNGVTPSAYESWSSTKNLKWAQFWADGSGQNFVTRNMTHALGGTTELRRTYLPNYMQQYFDTTLNKMLVYNGTAWVDMNGNSVD